MDVPAPDRVRVVSVEAPETLRVPLTSSVKAGFGVLIPTLPALLSTKSLEVDVPTWNSVLKSGVVEPMDSSPASVEVAVVLVAMNLLKDRRSPSYVRPLVLMRAVAPALVNGIWFAVKLDGVSVSERYVPPPVVIHEPLPSLKHPADSWMPFAKVEVAPLEVMFSTLAARPPLNVEVEFALFMLMIPSHVAVAPATYSWFDMASCSAGVEVPMPTLPRFETIRCGVEVPSSDTTNTGDVVLCSTDSIA